MVGGANRLAFGRRRPMRLTSVGTPHVIGADKNKNTHCTIQGGFYAEAQSCAPVYWAVRRDRGAGNGGCRRGSGKEDQDRRDLRPDRAARRRRLRITIY